MTDSASGAACGQKGKVEPLLISASELATVFGCSVRHVWRLHDAGKMPAAIRLGALVRWSRLTIAKWLAENAPPVRKGGR